MIDRLYSIAKPVLFRLDPESVHDRTIATLGRISTSTNALSLVRRSRPADDPRLAVSIGGLTLPGPIGIAAGLDKNAVAYPALHAFGWDFVEVGTITARPQTGNPRPRVFRLADDKALINRMGFPGEGADIIAMNLVHRRKRGTPVGVNIGPNKESVQAGLEAVVADCIHLASRFAALADYLVLNISSPNTAQLRDLQGPAALGELLTRVRAAIPKQSERPLFVKIAPDLKPAEIEAIVEVCLGSGIAGIVATNTTITRPSILRGSARDEPGGLSGEPLRMIALDVIRQIIRSSNGALPVIAVGGISSGAHAIAAFEAGASAVQIYTGLIYRGPGLAREIKRDMLAHLDRIGAETIADLRDHT